MKAGYTDIASILDRSGSMSRIKTDTEGGYNSFMDEQKKVPGECTSSLYQFDSKYEVVYENTPISEVPALILTPRGNTALLDAIGRTVEALGAKYAAMAEEDRPENVILLIMTDGEENASHEYTLDMVKSMLEHQQEVYNWKVIYLGANQDAIAVAGRMGISKSTSLNFAATAASVGGSYSIVSESVSRMRSCHSSDISYTDADRKVALGETPDSSV